MKQILFLFLCFSTITFAQNTEVINDIKAHQLSQNTQFKTKGESPLKEVDRKQFNGLDFFEIDLKYRVKATLKRTPETAFFNMKTTTSRVSEERVYGVVSFKIEGKEYKLNVYQGKALMTNAAYKDYLFLPFLDDTNSFTSYGGGRYIDLRIPKGDQLIIDFNKAYNPYCHYNETYSCPIVPQVNYVTTKINAGVKAFKK
ncbi:MAG: DUF1684 domain-containing protein [Flavobacteriaceae bacterium]